MSFDMPDNAVGTLATAAGLRELEQGAPKTTPGGIRSALVKAAQAIERHEQRAADSIRILEEALALRISVMDSQSRVSEVEAAIKRAMNQAVARLRG